MAIISFKYINGGFLKKPYVERSDRFAAGPIVEVIESEALHGMTGTINRKQTIIFATE
jgi:hypothetical protein